MTPHPIVSSAPPALPARASTLTLSALYGVILAQAYGWTLLPRHLEALGMSGATVGLLMGLRKAAELGLLGVWARAADAGDPARLMRWQFGLGAAALVGLPFAREAWQVGLCLGALGASASCAVPLMDALAMRAVGAQRFGSVRAWGSVGYALVALAAGGAGLWLSYTQLSAAAPWWMLALGVMAALLAMRLPSDPNARANTPDPGALRALMRRPALLALLGLGVVHWGTQAPFNLFFVALCESRALPAWVPGVGMALGVGCEVLVLMRADRLMRRVDPEPLLAITVALSAARWLATGVVTSAAPMLALQLIHGMTFGAFFAASIAVLGREIPDAMRAQGQAAFYLVVFGAGSIGGNALAGLGLDLLGAPRLFLSAGLIELGLLPLSLVLMRRATKKT